MFKRLGPWLAAHPRWTLSLLVVVALAPFLTKPFNIDDPLFIQLAHQVQVHPTDPFGFNVNWYARVSPMWTVTENPPGAGYYFAVAGALLGWSEASLHLAGAMAAVAVVLGVWRLARRCCRQPLLAGCAALFTPVFLVSANTVMCDVLMLAFWTWAVIFWVEGLGENRPAKIILAGVLVSLAMFTKYFGIALIPLLAVHGLLQQRTLGVWIVGLLIPLAALAVYQWGTHALYGHALLSDAAGFVNTAHGKLGFPRFAGLLVGLSFTGGCLAVAFFLAPCVWTPRFLALCLGAAALLGGALVFATGILNKFPAMEGAGRIAVGVQFAFWIAIGVLVLALLCEAIRNPRDPIAVLLGLWLLGTFLFAAVGNWTINGRSVLPMTPAVAILLVRRWEQSGSRHPLALKTGLGMSALLSLLVAQADFDLAESARRGAEEIVAKYGPGGGKLWFEGHWGFQYYMEKLGAQAVDFDHFTPASGDTLVVPLHNTYVSEPPPGLIASRDAVSVPASSGLATWQPELGAGFYSSVSGPLPFGFGKVPAESAYVYRIK